MFWKIMLLLAFLGIFGVQGKDCKLKPSLPSKIFESFEENEELNFLEGEKNNLENANLKVNS